MADVSDVEKSLVALIGGALFPSTTYLSGAYQLSSLLGLTIKLYRGWPEDTNLNADLVAGRSHVSVFPDPGMTRNTTRFFSDWFLIPTATPTVTATVAGATVTIGGTITAGNVVGVQFAQYGYNAAYAYIVQAGDTTTSIAAALAAQIVGGSSVGAVLTVPTSLRLAATVAVPQQAMIETRRQEQGFCVSCWCNTPANRDLTASTVDSALAGLMDVNGNLTKFFAVTPNERGFLRYRRSYTNDMPARDRVWRRDLVYTVEYPTTLVQLQPTMLFGSGLLTADSVMNSFGQVQPATSVETDLAGDVMVDAAGNLVGVRQS